MLSTLLVTFMRAFLGLGGGDRYLSDDADVCGARPVVWRHGVYNPDDVSLHHPHIILMALLARQLQELLDEVHDVCPGVHVPVLASHVNTIDLPSVSQNKG